MAPQGSGTKAASIFPESIIFATSALATATTSTVPPSERGFRPFSERRLKRHRCWVLPNWGTATFLPSKSPTLEISAPCLFTKIAPAFVAPAMMRTSPWDFTLALMAGTGPIYPISMSPANKASTSAGPALKETHSTFALSPKASSRLLSAFITNAWVWVTLGKYPICRVSSASEPPFAPQPPKTRVKAKSPAAKIFLSLYFPVSINFLICISPSEILNS